MLPELNAEQKQWVESTLASLTPEEKIGQIVCERFINIKDRAETWLKQYPVGSIYIGNEIIDNFRMSSSELKKEVAGIQHSLKVPVVLASDFEQGVGGQLSDDAFTAFPESMAIAAAGNAGYAYEAGRITAEEAGRINVHWTFADVADLALNRDNPIIGIRSYGDNPDRVIPLLTAHIRGQQEHNCAATAKHFPGDGMDTRNQHMVTSFNPLTLEEWEKSCGKVWRAVIDAGVMSIMVGHVAMPNYEDMDPVKKQYRPATASKKIIVDLLRDRLGFKGLLVSDALTMCGIGCWDDFEERMIDIVNAGIDMLEWPEPERFFPLMKAALADGRVLMERLDDAVRHVLEFKARLNLNFTECSDTPAERKEVAGRIAQDALNLLRNQNQCLPLKKGGRYCVLVTPSKEGALKLLNTFVEKLKEYGAVDADLLANMAHYKLEEYDAVFLLNTGRARFSDYRGLEMPLWKLFYLDGIKNLYLFAHHAWDIHADTDAVYEEINALYYGKKAWEGGMRDFRKLLSKTFRETPGCFGHGHSSPLGRCLDAPGAHQKLNACLDSAEKAAAADPDPRALKHVRREKEIFGITWEKFRADYLANYREFKSYRRQYPIEIDGVLNEQDWKNADTVSGFKLTSKPVLAEQQTYVKIVHEPEYLYFGMEVEEPFPEKMTANITKKDGPVWEDNTVELFLTHPDLGKSYYQIIINANGVVFDQFVQPGSKGNAAADTGIIVKTKRLKASWIIEAKIPTANLGEKCFDGQSWKINVLRARKIDGIVMHSGIPVESSTLSIGNPHNTDTFQPIHFCKERAVSISGKELDARVWKNGSFEEPSKKQVKPVQGEWKIQNGIMPASWTIAGRAGTLAVKQEANGRKFVELSGNLANEYSGKEKQVKITMNARGRGKCSFYWYCYDVVDGKRKYKISRPITEFRIDSENAWKTFTYSTSVPLEDLVKLAVHSNPAKGSNLQYDSIYITPVSEK